MTPHPRRIHPALWILSLAILATACGQTADVNLADVSAQLASPTEEPTEPAIEPGQLASPTEEPTEPAIEPTSTATAPTVVIDGEVIDDPETAEALAEALNDTSIFDTEPTSTPILEPTPAPTPNGPPPENESTTPTISQLGLTSSADAPADPQPFLVLLEDNLWQIDLFGLIEEETDADENCFTLLYTATAVDVANRFSYQLVSNFGWADTRLLSAGSTDLIEKSFSKCEAVKAAQQLGYFETSVLSGALEGGRIHLTESFRAPVGTEIEAIVMGRPGNASYIQAEALTAIPEPTASGYTAGGQPLAGQTITNVGNRIGFVTDEQSDRWEIEFIGVRVTDMSDFNEQIFGDGSCVTIVGAATLTNAEFARTSISTPELEVTSEGVRAQQTRCFDQELFALGYQQLGGAVITEGTTFHFQESFAVHDWTIDAPIHVVVNHFPEISMSTVFTGDTVNLASIAPAELGPPAPVLEAANGSATNAEFTWKETGSDTSVDVTIQGVQEMGPNNDGTGTCYVVFATIGVDAEIRTFDLPDISLVASGSATTETFGSIGCAFDELEDAGWRRLADPATAEVGTHQIAVPIDLPNQPSRQLERLIVGDPTDPNAGVFSIDLLTVQPSPN